MILKGQLTNISCLAGLFIIFLMAAFHNGDFVWIVGIVALLGMLIVRNILGEVSQKTDLLLAVLVWLCTFGIFIYIHSRI
jgi:uncharacterized membrane protein YccC